MDVNRLKSWKTQNNYKITRLLSGRSNVFLITYNSYNILIDTSTKKKCKKLDQRLTALNIHHINYLILTHTHFDHSSNSHFIKEKYKALVIIHEDETLCLTKGDNPSIKGTNLITKIIVKLFLKMFMSRLRYHPCDSDYTVNSVFDLKEFGLNISILFTPGHSPGSISIVVDNEIALVGDTLFGIFKNSVFPPYADNPKQMIESWSTLLESNCSLFLPSHGNEKNRKQLIKDYNKRKSTG